jgi:glycosyltransferase involved in cell wall biosynthesis
VTERPDSTAPPSVSIVAPFYDDADLVAPFVAAVERVLTDLGESYELLLVDDGSRDATWAAIVACAGGTASGAESDTASGAEGGTAAGRIRGLRLSRNFGKEAALCAGVERAAGAAVVTMDGDLQHPPETIAELVAAWRAGAQVVDGVKTSRADQSWRDRVASEGFNRIFSTLSGVPLGHASDFKLLDRRAVDAWLALPERTLFYRGTTRWIGFEHATVPFEVAHRTAGRSRWRRAGLLRLAINAVTAFSTKPLHLMTAAGLVFVAASAALLAQTLYQFARGNAAEGFTTVILVLLLQGGAIMVGIGIVGEYVARIHEEVKGRPRYIVSDATGETAAEPPPRR